MAARRPAAAGQTALVQRALRDTFGLARLRRGQQAVIDRVLRGLSTLAIMPTGAGKSLCYQLPACLVEGRTLVVSPLIALMKDQCDGLRDKGIAAVQINSGVDAQELRAAQAAAEDGSARIVMTTPEKLAEPGFIERLAAHPTALLVVDEAHCISQWGHDFRPAFLEIARAREALGKPCVLALTATAAEDVSRDIAGQLDIPASGILHSGSYRPNLSLAVVPVAREADKLEQALSLVKATQGSGLVYTATVKAAVAVHEALNAAGEPAGLYHGKLPVADRHAAQEDFMQGRVRVMVATNAFGLGIDKPDIRFVLHHQLPPGLEAYYQEAGRAGRDGQPASCTLLFLRADRAVQQFFMAGRYPTDEDAAALYDTLRQPPPDGGAWSLPLLQGRLARPKAKLQVALGLLRRHKVVDADGQGGLRLRQEGLSAGRLRDWMAAYRLRREQDRDALERMVAYAQAGQCRWRLLLDHLDGESAFERCGHCDNCRRIAEHEAQAACQTGADEAAATQAPRTVPAFEAGDAVQVRRYGRGSVEDASAWQVDVRFADGSLRSFAPEFVRRYKKRS